MPARQYPAADPVRDSRIAEFERLAAEGEQLRRDSDAKTAPACVTTPDDLKFRSR